MTAGAAPPPGPIARRPRLRRALRVAGVVVLVLAAIVAWYGYGALRIVWSVEPTAAYWERRATRDGELLYVALGDSAAQGIGADRPERGYVGLLADRITRETGRTVRVVNVSVSGAVVADVVAEQVGPLAALEPDVVTVAIGGNDAGRTDPAAFRRSFSALCAALPPGTAVADVPDFGGGPRRPAAAELARTAREVLAQHPRLRPVALERATLDMGWGDYAGDFFHPGDSGYVRWADAFWAVVGPALRR